MRQHRQSNTKSTTNMTQIKQNIGRLPIFKGPYVDGTWYKEKHRVTHFGSEFQAKQEGYLGEPVTVAEDGKTAIFNTEEWYIVSNGTDAFLFNEQIQKVYIITETKWAELQADETAFAAFCETHKRWSVDIIENGVVPPGPTPQGSTFNEATGVLTLDGVIDSEGKLALNATISADGKLTL